MIKTLREGLVSAENKLYGFFLFMKRCRIILSRNPRFKATGKRFGYCLPPNVINSAINFMTKAMPPTTPRPSKTNRIWVT